MPSLLAPKLSRLIAACALSALASTPAIADAAGPVPSRAAPAPFVPSADLDLPALERVVRARSAALQGAELDVDLAAADLRQARLLPNPTLDGSWSTIPLGETNPRGLAAPLASVPSYTVGLSYTFLLGKRGPREDRALAGQRGAVASLDAAARELSLSLLRLLGQLATATLRRDGIRGLVKHLQQIKSSSPTFVIFATHPKLISVAYRRFLKKAIYHEFGFWGWNITLKFKEN